MSADEKTTSTNSPGTCWLVGASFGGKDDQTQRSAGRLRSCRYGMDDNPAPARLTIRGSANSESNKSWTTGKLMEDSMAETITLQFSRPQDQRLKNVCSIIGTMTPYLVSYEL